MSGIQRSLSSKINNLLLDFPAVAILGVRQSGKTHLSQHIRPDWKYIDLENPDDFERVSRDPTFFFQENPRHLILDEAQEYPQIFRTLRGVIDASRTERERFLITGSSSEKLMSGLSDSLAGRIAFVELGTLKATETFQRPLSPFYQIFETRISGDTIAFLKSLSPSLTNQELKSAFLRGGYPEPIAHGSPDFWKKWMDGYFKTYLERDIRALFPRLDLVKFRRFVSLLSSLNGQLINKADIARALDSAESTVKVYLDIVDKTCVWRRLGYFEKSQVKSIMKMPRGGFRDSGLAHALLRVYDEEQLDTHPKLGNLFENFITEEILKGIECTNATQLASSYFRTKNGAEIDLILEGSFGLLPIEIKYGLKLEKKELVSLTHFVRRHHLPFGIVVNNSKTVERISEEIFQVPATLL
ncbi:AAA family ATPase [bacterium]|nr:AAA family ATPase [bacterium]